LVRGKSCSCFATIAHQFVRFGSLSFCQRSVNTRQQRNNGCAKQQGQHAHNALVSEVVGNSEIGWTIT